MSRALEITLSLPIVLPLLDLIHAQAATLNASVGQPDSRGDSAGSATSLGQKQREAALADVKKLVLLFGPDFPTTGQIKINSDAAIAVLRACAFLRLDLRQNHLGSIPDAMLEGRSEDKGEALKETTAGMCYLFLATLQELTLQHFPAPTFRLGMGSTTFFDQVKKYLGLGDKRARATPTPTIPPTPHDAWHVVVLNDPVNLMSYVTAVFQSTLGLPEDMAKTRMREVHEQKQSIVWAGSREKAEAHAVALQAWHLSAVAQPVGAEACAPIDQTREKTSE